MSETNSRNVEKVIKSLGFLGLINNLRNFYLEVNNETKTVLLSDKVIKALNDNEKSRKLIEAIDSYHENKDWDKSGIDKVFK